MKRFLPLLLAAVLLAGCSPRMQPPAPTAAAGPASAAAPAASAPVDLSLLSQQAWRVTASNAVAQGALYVFLDDGKLLLATAGSTPQVGTWQRREGNRITMVEGSQAYEVDVLELQGQRLRLRSYNPGTPVDLTLEAITASAQRVPLKFQGEWNRVAADCGTANNDSRLRIEAETLRLYESSGRVLAALPEQGPELHVVVKLEGAEPRLAWRRYRLWADGRTLTDVSDASAKPLVRVRCVR